MKTNNFKFIKSRYDIIVKSSNCGEKYVYNYVYSYNDLGEKVLIKDGKSNIYDIIQSHKDDNNLLRLFNRYLAGDSSVFDANKGIYIDTTELPTSYDELQNSLLEIRKKFNSSPIDLKNVFDNDFNKFVVSVKNNEVMNKIKSFPDVFNKYFSSSVDNVNTNTNNLKNDVKGGSDESQK